MKTRAKGKDFKVWFLVTGKDGNPNFLEGQSSHNENFDNATQTVSALKVEMPDTADGGAVYQDRIDGIRDLTGSVSFTRLKDADASATQKELLDRLKHAADTTTEMYLGYVESVDDKGAVTLKFTGYKTKVLIKSVSNDYPVDNEVSGSLNWENKGGVPIDIVAKTWAEAIAATATDAVVAAAQSASVPISEPIAAASTPKVAQAK